MPQFQLRLFDETREFDLTRQGDRLHISSGDLSVDVGVLYQAAGEILIEYTRADGTAQRLRLAGARQGEKRQLWIDGHILNGERVRRRGGGGPEQGSLSSPIPAVVSQILVQPGDSVRAGDKLILLESMKMVIPIQAPYDGRVVKILCAAGESVPVGVPLLEIETL